MSIPESKASGRKSHGKFYYSESVVLLVEDVLHKLPRQRLEMFSDVFKDMFCLPQGDNDSELTREGSSEENPIVLPGCTNFQFESLMELVYPSSIPYPELSKEGLLAALSLANRWEMEGVRKLILTHLTKHTFTPTEKVILGSTLDIPSYLKEGYISLVKSTSLPSLSEIEKLGWDTFGRIAYAREAIFGGFHGKVSVETKALRCTYCPGSRVQLHCKSGKHKQAKNGEKFVDPGMVYAEEGWYAPTRSAKMSNRHETPMPDEEIDAMIWEALILPVQEKS